MPRLVLSVFKTIIFAMIFVFIWDLAFYLYKVQSLNQRMENITYNMQRSIMENNYLPPSQNSVYNSFFGGLKLDMGSDFISSIDYNYGKDATGVLASIGEGSNTIDVRKDISHPASFGDIIALKVDVSIKQNIWGFSSTDLIGKTDSTYNGGSAKDWDRQGTFTHKLSYVYYIPCINYHATT